MSQEVEIKALKGESKVSRLKIRPDSERKPIKNPIGFELGTQIQLRSMN